MNWYRAALQIPCLKWRRIAVIPLLPAARPPGDSIGVHFCAHSSEIVGERDRRQHFQEARFAKTASLGSC